MSSRASVLVRSIHVLPTYPPENAGFTWAPRDAAHRGTTRKFADHCDLHGRTAFDINSTRSQKVHGWFKGNPQAGVLPPGTRYRKRKKKLASATPLLRADVS